MSEIVGTNYANFPLPNLDELSRLHEFTANNAANNQLSFDDLGLTMIREEPYIGYVISRDINHWQKEYAEDTYDYQPSEQEYVQGISEGYIFLIGIANLVNYIRSNSENVQEYIKKSEKEGVFPLLGQRELLRVIAVLEGNIDEELLDFYGRDHFIDTSEKIAKFDSRFYIFSNMQMKEILGTKIKEIKKSFGDKRMEDWHLVKARIDGFKHGVANATEMYLQAQEEKLIIRAEERYPELQEPYPLT